MSSGAFGPSALWRPDAGFRAKVVAACTNAGPNFGACFADQMRQAGASPDALAFNHLMNDNGYMQQFRPVGIVSIAQVEYPFRANENESLYLINGQPAAIDVDNLNQLPKSEMTADPAYQSMVKEHSDASLWPGDRSSVNGLLAFELVDGSQEFVADYRIQAGCHACAVLGQAFFSFRFDRNSHFEAAHFAGFTTDFGPGAKVKQMIATFHKDEKVTLLLPSNPSTGYSWRLQSSSRDSNLMVVGHNYGSEGNKRPGEGGEQRWSIQTKEAGESTLNFSYARPWEKDATKADRLKLTLRVLP